MKITIGTILAAMILTSATAFAQEPVTNAVEATTNYVVTIDYVEHPAEWYAELINVYRASRFNYSKVLKPLTTEQKEVFLEQYLQAHSAAANGAGWQLDDYVIFFVEDLQKAAPAKEPMAFWDNRFSQAGGYVKYAYTTAHDKRIRREFPKCWERFLADPDSERYRQEQPATVRYMNDLGSNMENLYYINASIEMRAVGRLSIEWISTHNKEIVNKMIPLIKRYLRLHNQSFITDKKTGYNPVQARVDEIIAALEAPRCQGFKEMFLDYCEATYPEFQWIDVKFMTPAEVDELKNKVYFGEIDFGEQESRKLFINLGVEAYNAFVKQYNGETQE